MDRLTEIRDRLKTSSPGPWLWDEDGWLVNQAATHTVLLSYCPKACCRPNDMRSVSANKYDAEFIAHSPEDVKYLLNLVGELQQEYNRLHDIIYRAQALTTNPVMECGERLVAVKRELRQALDHD